MPKPVVDQQFLQVPTLPVVLHALTVQVQMLRELNHPNLVRIVEYYEVEPCYLCATLHSSLRTMVDVPRDKNWINTLPDGWTDLTR